MEEDRDPPPQPRAQTPRGQEETGDRPSAPTVRVPNQEERGEPPVQQRALPAHGMPEQEEGNPPSQADEGAGDGPRGLSPEEGGDPPARKHVLPAHGMPEREEGSPLRQEAEDGAPSE